MKKLYSALLVASLLLSILPMVMAVSVGSGVTPNIVTEDFPPQVWMCDSRAVLDDNTEPGRACYWTCQNNCGCGDHPESCNCCTPDCRWHEDASSYHLTGMYLVERINNYAFEGEKIVWDVLVMDKNGIEKVEDVFATIGDSQGAGNDIEVNCILDHVVSDRTKIPEECNARIGEEELDEIADNMAAVYKCIFTVETPDSMYGQYWITVEAVDLDGLSGTMAENEYWFLNPVIALSIDGDMTFDEVRPGTDAYSSTMLVGNDADDSSGVLLDMFISGTDFYDSSSSGAKCPTTNQLSLDNFRYFATNGAYSTQDDEEVDSVDPNGALMERNKDAEGYVNIDYGIGFNNPKKFYDNMEIIQSDLKTGPYYLGNVLAPGAEMAVTFKLSLPEPCNGDFDTGSIYFWGEAI
jgi:hypothetical protein